MFPLRATAPRLPLHVFLVGHDVYNRSALFYFICPRSQIFVSVGSLEKGTMIRTWARWLVSTRKLKMLFSPAAELLAVFSFYLLEATRGFISPCLYHFSAAAKPAKHFAGFLHPQPLPHHCRYRSACEDLLPRWWLGSMWRVSGMGRRGGTCCRIGPTLSPGCLLGGCAEERRPHNRPIHHAATRTPESRSPLQVSFPPPRWAGQNLDFICKMVSSSRSASDWHVLDFFHFSGPVGKEKNVKLNFLVFLQPLVELMIKEVKWLKWQCVFFSLLIRVAEHSICTKRLRLRACSPSQYEAKITLQEPWKSLVIYKIHHAASVSMRAS